MRAALMLEPEKPLVIEDLKPEPPGPNEVIVAVGASGVCHSDLSVRDGLFKGIADGAMVLGHEGAGTVLEVGANVARCAVGDRVVAAFRPACGVCWYCVRDKSHLCDAQGSLLVRPRGTRSDGSPYIAMSGLGTFAETMMCSEASLVAVQTDLPDTELALLGCGLTTGVGAVLNTARVEPGAVIAVVGCGGVGQAAIQGARVAGAAQIIAVDPIASKRSLAETSGATDVVDPADGPPAEQVRALTGGRGVDYAFDVVGVPAVVADTYRMVGKGGMLVLVGYGGITAELNLPAFDLQGQEKTVKGCVAGSSQIRRDFRRFIELIERGRIDTKLFVSRTISLDEVNQAMDAMESGEVVRSVITTF